MNEYYGGRIQDHKNMISTNILLKILNICKAEIVIMRVQQFSNYSAYLAAFLFTTYILYILHIHILRNVSALYIYYTY
jgi:hypothetical protein